MWTRVYSSPCRTTFYCNIIMLFVFLFQHGLLLEKSLFDEGNPYIDSQQEICPIESPNLLDIRKTSILTVFKFNFPKKL